MIDSLAPAVRHLVLLATAAVLSVLIGWVQSDLPGVLHDVLPTALLPFAGLVVTVLVAVLTPLTRQYGVGSLRRPAFDGRSNPGSR